MESLLKVKKCYCFLSTVEFASPSLLRYDNKINTFTPDRAKSKIDEFSKITSWGKQHHSKVLLNIFPTNGHGLVICPYNQNLENFVLSGSQKG